MPLAADYSCFSQAIISNSTQIDQNYSISQITVNGIEYNINDSTTWTKPMLRQLRNDYYIYFPLAANYDYIQFIVKGTMLNEIGNPIVGCADNTPSRDSWVGCVVATNPRTYPHELGHCLGLVHRNDPPDFEALMCQTSELGYGTSLRKAEWDNAN